MSKPFFRAPQNISKVLRFIDKELKTAAPTIFLLLFSFVWLTCKIKKHFTKRKSVLFAGQAYYNCWYLSRALRKLGWDADLLNWDSNSKSQIYYHGEDYYFNYDEKYSVYDHLYFYISALFKYDIFHFSNAHGLSFSSILNNWFAEKMSENYEIYFLKKCGKKIVYSNNACLDGVSKTSFAKWGPLSTCEICSWNQVPDVCSDERNLKWSRFRNSVADFQINLGGNRADYNLDPTVHEVPEFYCLDPSVWDPNKKIPEAYKIERSEDTILLYHGVGNKKLRTSRSGVNIHCSHIYLPIIDKLKKENLNIELISPSDVPNKDLLYIQSQCDIFLDMLTYGWYGAMAREAMMLGKAVITFIRPEWAQSVAKELPEFIKELPIISADPSNVEEKLRFLIKNPDERIRIGFRSREFAIKWHGMDRAAKKFNSIYKDLLQKEHTP